MDHGLTEKVLKKRQAAEEHLRKSQDELKRLARLFDSGDGARLLEILSEMYYEGPMDEVDPCLLNRAMGRRDVVKFLLDIHRDAKEI